jgi:hypothetical protein
MSAMKIHELIEQIKENEYYWNGMELTAQQAVALAELTDAEYGELVTMLLSEPVAAHRSLSGEDYRKTYAHLIYGALLFCMRPDPTLYSIVLEGVLGIADPSSIQYGTAALRQVRSIEQIAADLFMLAEQRKSDLEVLSHIAWVFYWLGFTTEPSWRGGTCLGVDQCWATLYKEHAEPESDDQKIANITPKVGAFMKAYY